MVMSVKTFYSIHFKMDVTLAKQFVLKWMSFTFFFDVILILFSRFHPLTIIDGRKHINNE